MPERPSNDDRHRRSKEGDEALEAKNGVRDAVVPPPRESSKDVGKEAKKERESREPRDVKDRDKEKTDKGDKADKADKADRVDKAEKTDKADKADRAKAFESPPPSSFDSALVGERLPSIPPIPVNGPWRSFKEIVSNLADAVVDAQRPIRVLQAIRWDNSVEEQFFRAKGKELPKVDANYYNHVELGFDPRLKAEEFENIAREVEKQLGEDDPIGRIMMATALEYRDVVRMLAARGTPLFYGFSRKLYGSPKDKFPDGKSTVRDLGHVLYNILTNVDGPALGLQYERTKSAADCCAELNTRFDQYFLDHAVRVEIDDTILADAAAGSDYVKVRSGAKFSSRDIDILEVHEGWVHVATSLNGQQQTVAKWLAKGPPRTTAVQEGLAALLEIFTFRTYPRRARRINDRVLAVDKAEDGANFLEVYDWFRTEGYEEDECFHNTRRIFRGGVMDGGAPFTKDACYCKGIVLNYAFIRSAIQHNQVDLVPYLFVGKVAHEDVPVLARRVADGVIKPPKFLPPMFRDLSGLSIWMAYSTFFSQLGGEAIADHYAKVFARAG